jgi:hypothetical protein
MLISPKMPIRLLPVVLAFLPTLAFADLFAAKPPCYGPEKPQPTGDDSIDSYRMGNFTREAETYRYCIEDFISDQQKQLRNHQEALGSARDEWEEFRKRTLEK